MPRSACLSVQSDRPSTIKLETFSSQKRSPCSEFMVNALFFNSIVLGPGLFCFPYRRRSIIDISVDRFLQNTNYTTMQSLKQNIECVYGSNTHRLTYTSEVSVAEHVVCIWLKYTRVYQNNLRRLCSRTINLTMPQIH